MPTQAPSMPPRRLRQNRQRSERARLDRVPEPRSAENLARAMFLAADSPSYPQPEDTPRVRPRS